MRRASVLLSLLLLGCSRSAPTPPEGPATGTETPADGQAADAPATEGHSADGRDVRGEAQRLDREHGSAALPVTSADPQWGDVDAIVTIVEIADFECPFSMRVQQTLERIKKAYGPHQVRIVWKHQPLPFHKAALPAHEAAATVHALGGDFWTFHDLAFAHQRELTEANFARWAEAAGVDGKAFDEALTGRAYVGKVQEDMDLARKIGATGTPNFRINGVPLNGAHPFERFREVIDEQLAEGYALVDGGRRRAEVYPLLTARNLEKPPAPEPKADSAPVDDTVWRIPVYADDPVRGPADALVTIVQFSEFQCPFCKRVTATLAELRDRYGADLRIVWKDNPLGFHPRAEPAAQLARAVYRAKGNDAFWKVHDALFESQPKLEADDLRVLSAPLGVPWATLERAMATHQYAAKLEQSQDLAADFGARGTPHFFINGVRLAGAQPVEKFAALIDEQLGKAKAKVAAGTPRARIYEALTKDGEAPPTPTRKEVSSPLKDTPSKGPKKAPVVVQVFADFECPFSARALPTLEEVAAKHGKDVRFVWRNLPLPFHKHAALAAEAAHEVYLQKGDAAFWAFHDELFATQSQLKGNARAHLERLAANQGVDMDRFGRALDTHAHRPRVEADAQAAKDAAITATPTFVVDGYLVTGAQPYRIFRNAIRAALKNP